MDCDTNDSKIPFALSMLVSKPRSPFENKQQLKYT